LSATDDDATCRRNFKKKEKSNKRHDGDALIIFFHYLERIGMGAMLSLIDASVDSANAIENAQDFGEARSRRGEIDSHKIDFEID